MNLYKPVLLLVIVFCTLTVLVTMPSLVQALPGRSFTSTPIQQYLMDVFEDGSVQLYTFTPTWPIYTPTASITPIVTVEPSPTMEDTRTPTYTPQPTNSPTATLTPTPNETSCYGTVIANALNVRAEPWGEILGQVTYGQTLTFDAKWYYDFWWWRIEFWDAIDDDTYVGAWLSSNWIQIDAGADCSNLENLTPEKSNLSVGFFSMPNGNVLEQVSAVYAGANKGIVVGTHVYAAIDTCLQILAAGGICSYRPGQVGDCPNDVFGSDPRGSAQEFMGRIEGIANTLSNYENVWIDLINECNWGEDELELYWWSRFFDEAITIAEAWGIKLQLPSLGPGYGNETMFLVWKAPLTRLYETGGLFAMHIYNPVDTWLCPFNEWLADRHLHNYELMTALEIPVRMSLTEVGQGWGNTAPNMDDMICWFERTALYEFAEQAYIWEDGVNYTWPKANWEGLNVQFVEDLSDEIWFVK